MLLKLDFSQVRISGLVLAKVGNPSRDETLQTSKQIFEVSTDDQELLSSVFLRPFRSFNLVGQRFQHHSSIEQHEINQCVGDIFSDSQTLLERGCQIAKRLHSKSTHPNIKSGDLCIALIEGIQVGDEGETAKGLCLLKSESVTPFLSISASDGDLQLTTEHGINPEKIDKGCLVVEQFTRKGYYVLTFDRGSSESRFWVKDFLSVAPIPDNALLSKKVAEMAVTAITETDTQNLAENGEPSETLNSDPETPPWEVNDNAKHALAYFDTNNQFSLAEFEEKALRTPEAKKAFQEKREALEAESGVTIKDSFDISAKDASKAKKLMKSILKLDSGVEVRLKPKVVAKPEKVLEKGYDDEREMNYIKIYYKKELS